MALIILLLIPVIPAGLTYWNLRQAQKIICKPPNKFVQVFAPPGVGKTTLAAKIVRECTKKGEIVYSNVPIIHAQKFDMKDLGKYMFRHCTLIIDEAGTQVGNRNWQHNLDNKQIEFLKKHRHYDVDIYLFSQAYNDVDNKFRELTTQLLMLKKSKLPFYVYAMSIQKTMDLINGQIVEFFEWDKADSFRYFIPNAWAYFNSYEIDKKLPKMRVDFYTKSDTF